MIATLALLSFSAHAGPWVREWGGVYAKASVGGFAGAEAQAEAAAPALEYSELSTSVYFEAGLPLGLGIAAYLPYLYATNDDGLARYVAFTPGDADFALSRWILRGPVALSGTFAAKVPLYPSVADERLSAYGGYATRFPEAGDGQVDLDGRLDLGVGFPLRDWQGWTQASLGYRYRFGDFVDGVPWSVQLGFSPQGKQGASLGWVGVDSAGIVNVTQDALTKSWTKVGIFGAVRVHKEFSVETWASIIPIAAASRTGWGGGVGVSYQRTPPSP